MTKNRYRDTLLDYSSKLDALINGLGKITENAVKITENSDDLAVRALLKTLSDVAISSDYAKEVKHVARALKDSLIQYLGYAKISEICENRKVQEDPRTLDELLAELDKLVGLKEVKEAVNNLIAYQKVRLIRESHSLHAEKGTLHLAFMGGPGTGKTTVARIVGHIYKKIGLLSVGHFIEVSRTDLIAGYQGQTALKVKKVIEAAIGGVLFIDEAYSITENEHSDSYGRECLTELTKALEDYRNDLVVIVAGYTEPMNKFFDSNPGLRSRFNTFIDFKDYAPQEMEEILYRRLEDNNYLASDQLKGAIREYFAKRVDHVKDQYSSNGRMIRNLYDEIVMNHAKRVVSVVNPTPEILSLVIEEDFINSNQFYG